MELYAYLVERANGTLSGVSEYLYKTAGDAEREAAAEFTFNNQEYNYIVEKVADFDGEKTYNVYERNFGRKGNLRYMIHIIKMKY